MVARRKKGEERHRDGRQSRRHDDCAGRTFKRIDRLAERVRGRRSARAIGIFLVSGLHRAGIGKQYCRGTHHRRIDESMVAGGVVADMRKPRVDAGVVEEIFLIAHGISVCRGNCVARLLLPSFVRVKPSTCHRNKNLSHPAFCLANPFHPVRRKPRHRQARPRSHPL